MRSSALLTLLAATAVLAAPFPAAVRRQLLGDTVNGSTAISNPLVNNGAMDEGVLKDDTSFAGAQIINPTGNDLTKVNTNVDLHDNAILNPNVNMAKGTQGPVVVGNDNDVIDTHVPGAAWNGIMFGRRQMPGNSVNAPVAVSDPTVNSGAMQEGSMDAGVSANGATVVNPVGNDLTQLNQNEEISGNNLMNPNWNTISGNNGPALAGNNNIFVPVTNEAGAIQIDNGDLINAALLAGGVAV
ncbi:hypothetical protein GGI15_002561 [Coemansia interrupta]|uniref:Uncharacterized protein n=1 Tax=Coemansia interrupta TaxID=1126814 RepID=A0A9W8LKA1_9FUNG|nr:hypothetical protein GGI15_002561 [Coemansia interrupta]